MVTNGKVYRALEKIALKFKGSSQGNGDSAYHLRIHYSPFHPNPESPGPALSLTRVNFLLISD